MDLSFKLETCNASVVFRVHFLFIIFKSHAKCKCLFCTSCLRALHLDDFEKKVQFFSHCTINWTLNL